MNLCLVLLLTSCVRTGTRYIPVTPVQIPVSLLADCEVPIIPEPFTWGDSLLLNDKLITALLRCNNDKAGIREVERVRAKRINGESSKP
ncbi:Rz1-like lysis system protein LysC [Pantoea agglomerans]|uniref:Rz1-like lysis system protein LysC n=1 Tax=Enterobacter agglomerans TaxID=549 RepID=UPI003BF7E724